MYTQAVDILGAYLCGVPTDEIMMRIVPTNRTIRESQDGSKLVVPTARDAVEDLTDQQLSDQITQLQTLKKMQLFDDVIATPETPALRIPPSTFKRPRSCMGNTAPITMKKRKATKNMSNLVASKFEQPASPDKELMSPKTFIKHNIE